MWSRRSNRLPQAFGKQPPDSPVTIASLQPRSSVESPILSGQVERQLVAPTIRVEPRCIRVVPESFHCLHVAIGKAIVASFVVTQGRTAPIGIVARHTVRALTHLG